MLDLGAYLDEIDRARLRRVKELSELKRIFAATEESDPLGVQSKAVVVLSYAAWEGFYNECVSTYRQFLADRGTKVVDAGWLLLVGALSSDFESLRARNHSGDAKRAFVEKLKDRLECNFGSFDIATIQARSNLDFNRLSGNYALLGFDISHLQQYRVRIDKEVVGWRHGVAHGVAPDLNNMEVANHVELVSELLVLVADAFQVAMLERL